MHNFFYFFTFINNRQLIQYYALSHYHYIIINIIIIIIASSHQKHSMKHRTPYFTWKPKSLGKNHRSLYNSFPEINEGGNNPLITMTSVIQIQLEGGYNPLIYRLQPEGIYNSLVIQLQPEGGYNPLSFPRLAT